MLNGSIRLFRLFGIDVYLHWMWLVGAVYEFQVRESAYHNHMWQAIEYVTLFAMVTMHEFGHALACRSVGGTVAHIMLWPLGGIAFVNPPRRPGAHLWSLAAGPLVNVALIPLTLPLAIFHHELFHNLPADVHEYVITIAWLNIGLLIFNMLPIYPLDGGQILRSILWYFIGEARSLLVASYIGLLGAAAGIYLALAFGEKDYFLLLLAIWAGMQSWRAFQFARAQRPIPRVTRRIEIACPSCGQPPPAGEFWKCPCGKLFDTFATNAICPSCGASHDRTACPYCRASNPMANWFVPVASAAHTGYTNSTTRRGL